MTPHGVRAGCVNPARGDTLMTSSFGDYESQTDPRVSNCRKLRDRAIYTLLVSAK